MFSWFIDSMGALQDVGEQPLERVVASFLK